MSPDQRRGRLLQHLPRDPRSIARAQHLAGRILSIGRFAQNHSGPVTFVGVHQVFDNSSGSSQAYDQHPGRHRVERARVPDFLLPKYPPHLTHHVVRGRPVFLADVQDSIHFKTSRYHHLPRLLKRGIDRAAAAAACPPPPKTRASNSTSTPSRERRLMRMDSGSISRNRMHTLGPLTQPTTLTMLSVSASDPPNSCRSPLVMLAQATRPLVVDGHRLQRPAEQLHSHAGIGSRRRSWQ